MDRITAELLLGLKSPYGEEDISAAYKRVIRENHPDVLIAKGYSVTDANERAKQINLARDFLLGAHSGYGKAEESGQTQQEPWGGPKHRSSASTASSPYGSEGYRHHTSSHEETFSGGDGRTHNYGAARESAFRAEVSSERIGGETLPKKREGGMALVFASACVLLGIAALVSTFLNFPAVELPVDFTETHSVTCMILGPPLTLFLALVSWFAQGSSNREGVSYGRLAKRLRRTGMACAGFEYVYLAIWAWFLN